MSNLSQFVLGSAGGGQIPVEVFAVGGGGGGAWPSPASIPYTNGGGGGGGQVVYKQTFAPIKKSHTITIGAGGAWGPNSAGSPGSTTYFGSLAFASGGKGGNLLSNSPDPSAYAFGSGGGSAISPDTTVTSGDGDSPYNILVRSGALTRHQVINTNGFVLQTPGRGSTAANAGGGGGALKYSNPAAPAAGGDGIAAVIIGDPSGYGGGGGGSGGTGPLRGEGGFGGGGPGYDPGSPGPGTVTKHENGTAGTGGGGGGGSQTPIAQQPSDPRGNGGSGALIIRYPSQFAAATVTGNTPITAQSGYYVYKWISPGTITFN